MDFWQAILLLIVGVALGNGLGHDKGKTHD